MNGPLSMPLEESLFHQTKNLQIKKFLIHSNFRCHVKVSPRFIIVYKIIKNTMHKIFFFIAMTILIVQVELEVFIFKSCFPTRNWSLISTLLTNMLYALCPITFYIFETRYRPKCTKWGINHSNPIIHHALLPQRRGT